MISVQGIIVLRFSKSKNYNQLKSLNIISDQALREGIYLNDPDKLAQKIKKLVEEEEGLANYRPIVDELINKFDSTDRDTGRVYLTFDESALIDNGAGHYLIYGSEWIQCVLGWGAHTTLRNRGVPTVIDVRLPLRKQSFSTRIELARTMLHEWTRARTENRENEIRDIEFSFVLREPVPAGWIIGHHHPEFVRDPMYQNVIRRTEAPHCPACLD